MKIDGQVMPSEEIQPVYNYSTDPTQALLKSFPMNGYQVFALIMAGLTGITALVVLLGWLFNLPALVRILPIWSPMKESTALCFLMLAACLCKREELHAGINWFLRRCLEFVLLISGGMLVLGGLKDLFPGNVHLLGFELVSAGFGFALMPPIAAVGVFLSALSLLCVWGNQSSRSVVFSQALAVTVTLLGLFAFNGYMFVFNGFRFDYQQLREVTLISSVSFHTALLLVLVGLGILSSQPERGLMCLFSGDTPGGTLLRKLLPGISITILGVEWLAFMGHNVGWYSDLLGDVVATCLIIFLMGVTLFRAAVRLLEQDKTRKVSEKALFESEARFSAAFYQAAVGIAHVSLEGGFLRANPSFCDTVGYALDELLQLRFQNITFPEDVETNVEHLHKLLDGEIATYSTEKRYVRKDGSLVWTSLTVSVVYNMQKRPDYFIAVIKDISLQKQVEGQVLQWNKELEDRVAHRTEELLKANADLGDTVKCLEEATLKLQRQNTILENALEGIAKLDSQGAFISVNGSYSRITGYEPDELIGMNWERIILPDEIPKIKQAYRKTCATGKMELQTKGLRKDGSVFYKEVVLTTYYDQLGEIEGYYCFLKDITERVHLEQEKEKERKIFVSTLTHDMRTPLIAQGRVLDLLRDEFDLTEGEPAQLTDALIRNNENLLLMVNHLLESYQYEDGRIKLSYHSVPLSRLAGECIAETAGVNHQIRIVNNIPETLPLAWVDPQQIKRVFQNLLANALANISPNDWIEFSAREEEDFLLVQVSDNGPGIDPDIRPFLFERYFMGSKKQKIGSGLGLFICRLILQQHGSTIHVQSDPTTGTMFTFTLSKGSRVSSDV